MRCVACEKDTKPLGKGRPAKMCGHAMRCLLAIGRIARVFMVAFLALMLWQQLVNSQEMSWEDQMRAGIQAYQKGNYPQAERHWKAGLEEAKEFGSEDPRLATSLNNLALLYKIQGKYAEAEPLYQRSLTIREKVLGPEHPNVALSLNNLAALYQAQGKYAEAVPLFQRSLTILEKVLGPEHPNVATSRENYARLLRATNRSSEAAPLEARAKAIRDKAGGANAK